MTYELTVNEVVEVVLRDGTRKAEDVIVGYHKTALARMDHLETLGELSVRQAREYVSLLASSHDCLRYLTFAAHQLNPNYWVFPDHAAMRSSADSLLTA